jgi:hypothetical protein
MQNIFVQNVHWYYETLFNWPTVGIDNVYHVLIILNMGIFNYQINLITFIVLLRTTIKCALCLTETSRNQVKCHLSILTEYILFLFRWRSIEVSRVTCNFYQSNVLFASGPPSWTNIKWLFYSSWFLNLFFFYRIISMNFTQIQSANIVMNSLVQLTNLMNI